MDSSLISAVSIVGSLFSIVLAVFAIWLAFQQRKESQNNYEQTNKVLGEVRVMMEKTELLVSKNFQDMLKSMTEQQGQMLESLKPRKTPEDFLFQIAAESPEKLDALVNAIAKVQGIPGVKSSE